MTKVKNLLVLLIVFSSTISLFHIARFRQNFFLPDYDQYSNIVNINMIKNGSMPNENVYLLDILVALFKYPIFVVRILPFAIGCLSIILLYYLSSKIIKDKTIRFVTILIIIISPVFIYYHLVYNEIFVSLFLIILGVYLILLDRYVLSLLCLILSFALNIRLFFVIILVLLILYEKLKSKNVLLPLLGIVSSSYVFISMNGSVFPKSIHFLLTYYLSDLGAIKGLGVFSIVLAVIGLTLSWQKKKDHSIIYYSFIALVITSIFDSSLILFLNFIVAYYSGLALVKIINSKWHSQTLKNYVLILIMCGLVFSYGAYIQRFSEMGPNYSEVLSLEWLKNKEKSVVLSHYEYGFLIRAFSEHNTFTDTRYYLYSKDKTNIKLSLEIFYSRDLNFIKGFLDHNKIKYIWINDNMLNGQVWTKKDEGMLLILENSASFKKVYDYLDVKIWEYLTTK